jgi:hypothetical protein
MGTKLSFNYEKTISRKLKYPYEEPFYCKENPSEVLPILVPKYHVVRYNTVTTNLCDRVQISTPQDYGIFPRFTIEGLNIVPYDNEQNGLTITKSVADFAPGIPESDLSIRNAQMIVDGMITKFLVDVEILDFGTIANLSHTVMSYGKQKATNYLRERKDKKNILKEQNLEDILVYGKVVLGPSFNEKYMMKVADRVVKSIPEKFDPRYGSISIKMF